MSGSTIGGVVGGVIGFFVGGPAGAQWGFMIGSFVGAVVDPDRIYGPRLTDVRDQAASDGVPRTYGYGRFPTTGNIIWRDLVKEIREKSGGKGGPQQITYRYTRSYAIGVCRGPISGYLIIKRNGKIVYDTRPDAELLALGYTSQEIAETRAAQAKFTEIATLYYGDQTTPDPTMVAVKGAGNVPNYTDTAYMVCTDDDVTDIGGAVPQYEFVVSDCGERNESSSTREPQILVTGAFAGADKFARSVQTSPITFEAIPSSSGADINAQGSAAYGNGIWSVVGSSGAGRFSADGMETWQESSIVGSLGFTPKHHVYGNNKFVVASNVTNEIAISNWPPTVYTVTTIPVSNITTLGFAKGWFYYSTVQNVLYRTLDFVNVEVLHVSSNNTDDFHYYFQYCEHGGYVYATRFQYNETSAKRHQLVRSLSGLFDDVEIVINLPPGEGVPLYWMEVVGGQLAVYRSNGFVYRSGDNFATPVAVPLDSPPLVTSGPLMQGRKKFSSDSGVLFVMGQSPNDTQICYSVDLVNFTLTSTPQDSTVAIVGRGDLDEPGVPIPDAPGFYIDPLTGMITGPTGVTIDSCTPTLGSIVAEQCISRNVVDIDVSELTDPVTGFRIASVSSPQKNIAALMPAFMFDGSEFDGVLHFPKRGRSVSFALTVNDLVERQGDPIQWERTQEPELLRKLTVGYIDPATTFTPTTQQWERRAGTVQAEGESTMELPVVAEKDWAAQVAEKAGKVAWAEADKLSFWVSREWASLVPAAVGTITDEKGVTHRVRILRIEDDGGVRMIHAVRDRQDAYESTATGAQKPLPLFPGSDIRGPTLFAVMNMPVLRDEDDRPGLYWGAAGFTAGWAGARLQVLRAGEWETMGDITTPSGIGALVDPLPGHSGDIDEVNVLKISIADPLSSVTFTQLLRERNAIAIVRPDNTVEVVQFQNATQVSENVWECTTLIRGNLNTDRSGHDAGATVAVLDSGIRFVDLRPDDLGKTLNFRVFSLGTDPDTATPFTITFPYIWSSTEWHVAYLNVEQDGDDYELTWVERRRLGTDVDPIRSGNWEGYVVSYAYSGISNEVITSDPFYTFNLPGASDIDFTVSQLNRLTGRGPETTENVP